MAATPVEILGLKYPLCKELIHKLSNNWQQRTKIMMTKWPKEGKFDVSLCEEMETLIKNHKSKGNSKKREKKRIKNGKREGSANLVQKGRRRLNEKYKTGKKNTKRGRQRDKEKRRVVF